IRNSSDVNPKGDMIYRPATVKVEVLPPVETDSWTTDTIDEHVETVRDMFLRVLGQDRSGKIVTTLKAVEK
ncbi:MAG: HAD-IB family hydrolase, partial [Gammaproteobacteria bacterium]|nr:HAD-IB family hydrolase [Gammaproteobacteria bacterium]